MILAKIRPSATIYATARVDGAEFMTCEAHFSGLPGGMTMIQKVAA
jgi:hypothetical protein